MDSLRQQQEQQQQDEEEGPATATTYEHVYCSGEEGQLTISAMGIFFASYFPENKPRNVWLPNHLQYGDIMSKEFRTRQVVASYGSQYSTTTTMYEFKLVVYPSKEVVFQTKDATEWERLQCDLEARGHGAPVIGNDPEEAVPVAVTGVAPGFTEDDYDGMPDEEAEEEAEEEADVEWQEEANDEEDEDVPEGEGNHRDDNYDNNDEAADNVGWSAADAWTAPDTSYYPVRVRQEVGTLKLSGTNLQFVPDKHSAPVKNLPWTSLAGKPFYAPYNYPQATMHVHYHTTRGPNKKCGFDVDDFEALTRLREDVTARMRPFRNAPREKVYVPPKPEKQPRPTSSSSRSANKNKRSTPKQPKMGKPGFMKKKSKVAPSGGAAGAAAAGGHSTTEDGTSQEFTESNVCSSAVPLVVTPAMRRRRHHKDEQPRRMWMLFMSYCCIVTLTGLMLSILFGYFFGPRKSQDQYIRTQPPGSISSYLGTKPPAVPPTMSPTMAPTVTRKDSFAVGSEVFQRDSITEAPEGSGQSGAVTTPPAFIDDLRGEHDGTGTRPNDQLPDRGDDLDLPNATDASAATLAPTVDQTRSEKSIVELLMESSFDGGEALRTMNTPQQAAYLLLKVSGTLDEQPSDAMVEQKYALATLYYSTGGDEWNEGRAGWKDLSSSDCVKTHVVCDEPTERAVWIDMPNNNMKGKLPPELGMLTELRKLDFSKNELLTGTIPSELGLLTQLEVLDLSGNPGLIGTVPSEIRNLPSLTTLKVDLPEN